MGDILCELMDVCSGVGFYIVNDVNELFYIDIKNNINKFLIVLKGYIIFI